MASKDNQGKTFVVYLSLRWSKSFEGPNEPPEARLLVVCRAWHLSLLVFTSASTNPSSQTVAFACQEVGAFVRHFV